VGGVPAQVLAQDLLVQRVTWMLGAGMRVCVDETGQQPAFRDQFGAADRIGGPAVAVGVEVYLLAVREGSAAYPENRHPWTLGPENCRTPPIGF
jgi:hypothetical protein